MLSVFYNYYSGFNVVCKARDLQIDFSFLVWYNKE